MKSGVRIIGGRWRGRKLPVVDIDGLRPTPDRIRETLFNWLAADCRGARVLDCFAGSGALGFEALSRGASWLTVVEHAPAAVNNLRRIGAELAGDSFEIVARDAAAVIGDLRGPFDLIFIDPPYVNPELRQRIFLDLERGDLLRDGARIYFEWPRDEVFELPSPQLRWLKQKRAGQVNYAIAEWSASG